MPDGQTWIYTQTGTYFYHLVTPPAKTFKLPLPPSSQSAAGIKPITAASFKSF